jgi:hypothetical protein
LEQVKGIQEIALLAVTVSTVVWMLVKLGS